MKQIKSVCLYGMWMIVLTFCFVKIIQYSGQNAENAIAPTELPKEYVENGESDFHLYVFFHPKCPCSMATARELEQILAKVSKPLKVTAVFYESKSKASEWAESSVRDYVSALSGVEVVRDDEGLMTSKFGVKTSGQVLLYGKRGQLLFEGGITPARGHEGESTGRLAILHSVEFGDEQKASSKVFGCHILKEADLSPSEGTVI